MPSVVRSVVLAAEDYNTSFDLAQVYCLPYSYVKSISQAKNPTIVTHKPIFIEKIFASVMCIRQIYECNSYTGTYCA